MTLVSIAWNYAVPHGTRAARVFLPLDGSSSKRRELCCAAKLEAAVDASQGTITATPAQQASVILSWELGYG